MTHGKSLCSFLMCIFVLTVSAPTFALVGFEFSPTVAEIILPSRETAFEFTNTDVTRVFEFVVTDTSGQPVSSDTALAYPPTATVVSGAKQAVRVIWRGPSSLEKSRELRLRVTMRAPVTSPYEEQFNGVAMKTALSLRIFVYDKAAVPILSGKLLPPASVSEAAHMLELENMGEGAGKLQLLKWSSGAMLPRKDIVMPHQKKTITFTPPSNAMGELKLLVEHQGWVVVQ